MEKYTKTIRVRVDEATFGWYAAFEYWDSELGIDLVATGSDGSPRRGHISDVIRAIPRILNAQDIELDKLRNDINRLERLHGLNKNIKR